MAFENFSYLYISYESTFNHTTMKKLLTFLFLFVFAHSVMADDMLLQIWQSDGQVVTINLNEEPVTTYSEGNLIITTTNAVISYPLENVVKYTYISADGITTLESMNTKFSQDGETLIFSGLKQDTEIAIYSSAGQMMKRVSPNGLDKVSVSVSSFSPGVYLIKVNSITYKITKR